MGDVIRLNASAGDEDSWWIAGGGTQEEAANAADPEAQAQLIPWERRDHSGALNSLSDALWDIVQATGAADTCVSDAADALLEGLDFTDAAATVALIQDIRRRLQVVEQYLTKRLGEAAVEASATSGELPDGRQWEVKRGNVRKAWDHESWKHDARGAVTRETIARLAGSGADLRLVDANTGEEVAPAAPVIIAAITAAQEVHGSTAPRVTNLRALGMDPDDYAESHAGLWGLAVASPDPTTTTEE